MANEPGLVVPVDVVGYCVGVIDAHERTGTFAGATTAYDNTHAGTFGGALGVNVTRGFDQSPLWQMEAGIHLHWAAPDALTHGTPGDDGVTFPALPNRWLVSRLLVQGGTCTAKHWIMESDTLSPKPPGPAQSPTLPVDDDTQNFRYLGVWEVFDGSWREPGSTIHTLFGSPLHAVASGDIAFAALYPNSRNVFGFYDAGADISVTGGAAAELAYVVTGWFSDPANDPLTGGPAPEALQASMRWTYTAGGTAPSYSLYSGVVQGLQWNPATRYVHDDRPPVQVDLAVGNNPAEALAAYFRGLNHPSLPLFEQLFTAFETGLLSTFKQPQPGMLGTLAETIHERGFSGMDAGTIHTIVAAVPPAPPEGAPAPVDDEMASNLPLPLADALNLLNQLQQQCDLASLEVGQYQWQLFADWYRLFQVDPNYQTEAFNSLSRRLDLWGAIQQNLATAQAALAAQTAVVTPMLGKTWELKEIPAPRFWQPSEPVVLMAGPEIAAARRHGGDGRFDAAGYLVCRLTSAVVTAATVAVGSPVTISAGQFSAALPPAPNGLPHPDATAALVAEACILDSVMGAALAGGTAAALATALAQVLAGTAEAGNPYTAFTGTPPSPVEVQWWEGENPWLPLIMLWEADFQPFLATATPGGQLNAYPATFFTGNFALDPDAPGCIAYTGTATDPQTLGFAQKLTGSSVLSATSADNLEALLEAYLPRNPDTTLQAILGQLQETNILMQALTGFNAALLMRQQSLQLSVGVSPDAPFTYRSRTRQVQAVITDPTIVPPLAPLYNGSFNPLRAGYMKLALRIVDTFGEKRSVAVGNVYMADPLTTRFGGQVEPSIAYLQPRLAQGARVLFRWLSADSAELDEMNSHPATSPVCGWLLTNHLQQGLFVYNAQGRPLGSVTVNGDQTALVWQSAPGDDRTIDQDVATVMAYENVHLRDFVVALAASTVGYFQALWAAVDHAGSFTVPPASDSGAGLGVLVGQPVALAQASLLLELQGITAYNQGWETRVPGDSFRDTDNGLGGVQFPAVLGDLSELDDGLVGYFKMGNAGYDFSTFYTEAAAGPGATGVVQPSPTNVLLTPSSTPEGSLPSVVAGEQKLLMLLDPRAGVHVTTGILPTQFVQIPAEQYADTLRGLEVAFLTTPVLKPLSGLALPLAAESGYTWSWVEEAQAAGTSQWVVTPDVDAPAAGAVWQYTPQTATEGWLRLNARLLRFALANSAGAPVATGGAANTLQLTVTNLRQAPLTFQPGVLATEGTPPAGSVFYMHLGALVAADQVAAVQPTAPGWSFKALSDAQYGAYWGATPTAVQELAPDDSFTVSLANVQASSGATQAQVYFDYYDVQGVSDGVDVAVLAIQNPT